MNDKESKESFEIQYNRIAKERVEIIAKIEPKCNLDIIIMGFRITSEYYEHKDSDYGDVEGYESYIYDHENKKYLLHNHYTDQLLKLIVQFSAQDFKKFVKELGNKVNELNRQYYEKRVESDKNHNMDREEEFKQKLEKMK